MQFDIDVRIGFGVSHPLGTLRVEEHDIDHVGQFAGAYHVLEMGQHFRDYVVRGSMPLFADIPGFPRTAHYEPLTNKQRAQGVTGNIGEAIAGLLVQRVLQVRSTGIAHIRLQRPFRRRQCPDFMIRLRSTFPAVIAHIPPLPSISHFPEWWPLESKARVDGNGCESAAADAFRQLAAYWYTIAFGLHSGDVGYGLISTCAYDRNQGIRLWMFVPRRVQDVVDYLRSFRSYDDFIESIEDDDGGLRRLMHYG